MTSHTHTSVTLLAKYERAKTLYDGILDMDKIALNTTIVPHWIGETNCFWYRRKTWRGTEFRLVDANAGSNKEAFDHQVLADALAASVNQTVEAACLPITRVTISLSPLQIHFSAFNHLYTFKSETKLLKETVSSISKPETIPLPPSTKLVSPDGKQAAFVKEYNLWLQNLETNEERPLTQDGEPCYSYATSPVALGLTVNAQVQASWSPDSKQLFTLQTDKRQVKTTPILHHIPVDGSLRPQVEEQYSAYPNDEHVEEIRLVVISVETSKIQEANYSRIPVKRFGHGLFTDQLAWWSNDSCFAYFVDLERNGQTARVVELETHSGNTRILFEDTSATYIQLSVNEMTPATLQPLTESNELIWYSECSGWAHLYLYDLKTGALKHPITKGDWLIRDILHVDATRRELWIQTAGRVNNRDPYYRDICRVNIDTGELTTLASDDKEYTVLAPRNIDYFWHKLFDPEIDIATCGVSPDGNYLVTSHSRIDQSPVSQLLDRNGKVLLNLEEADLSRLPNGWQWPELVKLTATDGETAIYGSVFKPSDFSPDKLYPVIDGTLCSPECNITPKGLLRNDTDNGFYFLHAAALAELGFIVVFIDGRGSACRDKAFIDYSYGWLPAANNTDDRIVGIKQLAEQRPYMNLDRVGFMDFGSDGGALFRYPDFYKVSVCFGLMDTRFMAAALFGEQFEGVARDIIDAKLTEQLASNLQGKLLLIHGLLDPIAPPTCTFRIVEALQLANKNFDLLILPNYGHGTAANPYACRRAWDYFVRHLQGIEPPKEFQLALVAE